MISPSVSLIASWVLKFTYVKGETFFHQSQRYINSISFEHLQVMHSMQYTYTFTNVLYTQKDAKEKEEEGRGGGGEWRGEKIFPSPAPFFLLPSYIKDESEGKKVDWIFSLALSLCVSFFLSCLLLLQTVVCVIYFVHSFTLFSLSFFTKRN